MGLDVKRRRLARSLHAEMYARDYGKYLFLKHRDTIERLFLSFDMLVPEKDLERMCSEILHDIFKSLGICIRYNIEVRFTEYYKSAEKSSYFTVKYIRRNGKATIEDYIRRRDKNT